MVPRSTRGNEPHSDASSRHFSHLDSNQAPSAPPTCNSCRAPCRPRRPTRGPWPPHCGGGRRVRNRRDGAMAHSPEPRLAATPTATVVRGLARACARMRTRVAQPRDRVVADLGGLRALLCVSVSVGRRAPPEAEHLGGSMLHAARRSHHLVVGAMLSNTKCSGDHALAEELPQSWSPG